MYNCTQPYTLQNTNTQEKARQCPTGHTKKDLRGNDKIHSELNCNSNKRPKAAVCVFYEVIAFDGTESCPSALPFVQMLLYCFF